MWLLNNSVSHKVILNSLKEPTWVLCRDPYKSNVHLIEWCRVRVLPAQTTPAWELHPCYARIPAHHLAAFIFLMAPCSRCSPRPHHFAAASAGLHQCGKVFPLDTSDTGILIITYYTERGILGEAKASGFVCHRGDGRGGDKHYSD